MEFQIIIFYFFFILKLFFSLLLLNRSFLFKYAWNTFLLLIILFKFIIGKEINLSVHLQLLWRPYQPDLFYHFSFAFRNFGLTMKHLKRIFHICILSFTTTFSGICLNIMSKKRYSTSYTLFIYIYKRLNSKVYKNR